MMRALLQVLLNGVALLVASKIVPGISRADSFYLLLAGFFWPGQLIVKPITTLLSLPFIILTLGLFFLIINALMLKLTAFLLDGFSVQGFMPAIFGGIVIAVFNWAISALVKD